MSDLDERLRRVFDAPSSVSLDEVREEHAAPASRPRIATRRLIAIIGLVLVLGGGIALSASRSFDHRANTSSATTTSSPSVTTTSSSQSDHQLTAIELRAISSKGFGFSGALSKGRVTVTERAAVRAATAKGLWAGSRLVAVGLTALKGSGGGETAVWAVLVDPPGSHACIGYGPKPAPSSCKLNVYVAAISATTGANLFSATAYSALLPPLVVWTRR